MSFVFCLLKLLICCLCASYNKHGSKACSDHHIREENLVNAILNEVEKLLGDLKGKDLFSKLEAKIKKQYNKFEKELQSVDFNQEANGLVLLGNESNCC